MCDQPCSECGIIRKPFSELKGAAHEVAEALSTSLDTFFTVSDMAYAFERFDFVLKERGIDDGMEITLSISADNLERFFRELP